MSLILIAESQGESPVRLANGAESPAEVNSDSLAELLRGKHPEQPVEFESEVIVTYWAPDRSQLFVKAHEQGAYVKLPESLYYELNLQIGDVVAIHGKMSPKKAVFADALKRLRTGPRPKPFAVKIDDCQSENHWSRFVQVSGIVEFVCVSFRGADLIIRENQSLLRVHLNAAPSPEVLDVWHGQSVNIVGVLDYAPWKDGKRRPIVLSEPRGLTMQRQGVQKTHDPSSRPSFRTYTVAELLSEASTNSQVRLEAQINHVGPRELLLESGGRSMLVDCPLTQELVPGTVAKLLLRKDAVSKATGDRWQVVGVAATRREEPAAPRDTTIAEIIEGKVQAGLVSVEGELASFRSHRGIAEMRLSAEGQAFRVTVPATDAELESLNMRGVRKLRCVGLLRMPQDQAVPPRFMLQVGALDDIVVTERWLFVNARSINFAFGGLICVVGIAFAWVTTLRIRVRRGVQRLAEISARMNTSYDAIREGILVVDMEDTVVGSNRALGAMFAVAPQPGHSAAAVRQAIAKCFEDPTRSLRLLASPHIAATAEERELLRRRPAEGTILLQAGPIQNDAHQQIGWLWTFDDVTNQRALESQLVQSQKMEAVGRLAGGVAHDFNNLLMSISASLECVALNPERQVKAVSRPLELALKATDQAATLVRNLLSFSRRAKLDMHVGDVNNAVKAAIELLEPLLKKTISLSVDLDRSCIAKFDPTHLSQVVINLCLNARDAMPDGGQLRIMTRAVSATAPDALEIVVRDTGCGIAPEIRDAIFDPFFTTKQLGEGTGLGLSSSLGIVQQHHGQLICENTDDGAEFVIRLPRIPGTLVAGPPTDKLTGAAGNWDRSSPALANPSGEIKAAIGSEATMRIDLPETVSTRHGQIHVLLTDDDALVRESGARLLQQQGLRVTTAASGEEALSQILDTTGGAPPFDIVLLDLKMPGLSGLDTFHQIREAAPALPVLICSGHLFDLDMFKQDAVAQPEGFISKPFHGESIRAKLVDVVTLGGSTS